MTTYQLSNIKQLIDLNGDAVNFNLNFDVTATNGETFKALVVTQETLDSNQNLNYQTAKGSISGSINSDQGQYQNYFLVLKADQPTEVIVSINIEHLPDSMISNFEKTNYHHQQYLMNKEKHDGKKKNWFVRNRSIILISIFILFLIVFSIVMLKDQLFSSSFFSSMFSDEVKEVNEKINGGFKQLNDTIDGINTGISSKLNEIGGLNSKIEDISNEISGLKGGLNESLKSDTVLTKIDGLANEINGIKGGLSETITTKFDGLREGYESLSSKINDRLSENTDFGEIKHTLNSIKEQVDCLSLTPPPPPTVQTPLELDRPSPSNDILQKVRKLNLQKA